MMPFSTQEFPRTIVKLCKRLLKSVLILFCLLCLVATIQTGAGIYFSKSEVKLEPADLVVVFPGEKYRIESGLEVVKNGAATHFMVISTTQEKLQKLLRKNEVPKTVTALAGGKSRSIFEDVYQTAKTIKENHFSSVIVG